MSHVKLRKDKNGWKVTKVSNGWKDTERYLSALPALLRYLEWQRSVIRENIRKKHIR